MSKKRMASFLLALAMMALVAAPALAVPPDRIEIPFNPTYEVADCGTFKVMNHEESTLRLTFFYDTEGTLVRVNQYWSGTDTLTNSVTGKSISSDFTNHAVIDETDFSVHQGGTFWKVIAPREGPVFFEAGRFAIVDYTQPEPVVTFSGASITDEDAKEALCALLDG